MELKQIKVRYAGKCGKCDRDIREGWDAFFDAATKTLYCRPCAKTLENTPGGIQPVSQAPLTEEEIQALPPEIQERLRTSGFVKKVSVEEQVANLANDLTFCVGILQVISDIEVKNDDSMRLLLQGQHELAETIVKILKAKTEIKKEV